MTLNNNAVPELSAAKRALLEKRLKGRAAAPAPAAEFIRRRAERDSAPLSFAQQRLWFLSQMNPGSVAYNMPAAFRLIGQLDVPALRKSLNEIIRRHEILRTGFRLADGQPRQFIEPHLLLNIEVRDLTHLDEEEREREAVKLANEEAERPFDLERAPLLRVKLLRVGAQEQVLLVTMHHIVTDGWSIGVMVRELGALYEAYAEGRSESPLEELAIQYGDYAVWQREYLRGEVLEGQLGYWREQLAGASFILELPTDHTRPPAQSFRGAQFPVVISQETTQKLEALSRREGMTLFMTLLAAFQTLLYRHTGQADITVGTPIANRTRSEIEGLIGFFVNTLALSTDLSGALSFRELMARVREVTLEAYAHQDVPFEKLVEELQQGRDLSRNPLFQVMFALQNMPSQELEMPGITFRPQKSENNTTRFDLEFHLWEDEKNLRGLLVYSTDLFEEATVRRLFRHFEVLLSGIVANPDERITRLPLLAPDETRRQLVEWNDTARELPAAQGVHELFAAQVERTPDAVALTFGDESLSYRELDARANALALRLREIGVGAESVVGICVERSLEMIVGLLGVLKVGGAYLPLDPEYPQERISFMLADAGARVLLTQERLVKLFDASSASEVICLDCLAETPAAGTIEKSPFKVSEGNLAYVIYTSGSTGKPKAIMMPHRPLVNLIRYQLERSAAITRAPRTLQFASLSFDVSFQEIFSTLCAGGTLVLVGEEMRRDTGALLRLLKEERVERLFLPFVALQALAETSEREGIVAESLREVITAGEQLKITRAVAGMFEKLKGGVLDNHYGPSETHAVTAHRLRGAAREWPELPPIGRPIANARLYVLNREMQPAPIGVAGELYIAGDCVSRGYLNRADVTAEKFVPDPFSAQPGARLYRTGDLARYLPDGNLEFLGRDDDQVKIRGYRIELGEVEAALATHEAVRETVVVVRTDEAGAKRLVAYVVAGQSGGAGKLGAGQMREYLKERLPEYMIPSAFVLLERFPLTQSGKVNRRALPAPDTLGLEAETAYVAPRNAAEEMLAAMWIEVLGVKRVGVRDNFFELGGHSLLATQLISRVRKAFEIEMPLRRLFEQPTVEGLARSIEGETGQKENLSAPRLVPVSQDGHALPLSFAQQRLWFLDHLVPGSAAYNLPTALRLRGVLNLSALERSLNEIVRRHEILRTGFRLADGQPRQFIEPQLLLPIEVRNLTHFPEVEREREVLRQASEEAQLPFDLERAPLLRVKLMRLSAGEQVLLVTMHHIVTDGWSMGVMVRELGALYEAYSGGASESPLGELELQYGDYAVWQREYLRGEILEGQLSYWREQLAGASFTLELPTDRPRPAVQTYNGAQVSFALSRELSERLHALSRRHEVTLFMALLAAWQTLLYRYTGQTDIIVGSPIANRTRSEIEGLIGFFVNTLVLRTDMSGEPTFADLLARVREVTLGAYAHQDVPFEKLVEELPHERSLSRAPLFQVMFILQNAPLEALELSGLTLQAMSVESPVETFDLTLNMGESQERIYGGLSYNTDLFDAATIRRMCRNFERLLEAIAAPPPRLHELPLLAPEERQQLLVEWNDTQFVSPSGQLLHEMFEVQAERAPYAVALVYKDETITFRELNARANKLAHHLRSLGVKPDTIVGIMSERSTELVVGLLGVLKAGGAYLPLDPEYPPERINFMLADARVSVLLAQRRLIERLGMTDGTTDGTTDSTTRPKVICLEEDWAVIAPESEDNPESVVAADNLAYVLYTSGSTGQPKGVMISHRAICNRLSWGHERLPLCETDRILQITTISFDVSVWEFFAPLVEGACLVLAQPGEQHDIASLSELIRRERITILNVVPSLLQVLLEDERFRQGDSLRRVFVGGEAMPVELPQRFFKQTGAELYNLYGPTESTIDATWWKCERDAQARRSIPIGRAVGNVQAYVLDERMEIVPVGVAGELYLGGEQLARGYLNRPELTAEKFVPDPFGQQRGGARLYRTGDLVRYLPGGQLEFLRRIDDQVKIRGFRIEVGEVEAALASHPAIKNVVVLVADSTPAQARPAHAGVGNPDSPEALRAHLLSFDQRKLAQLLEEIENRPEMEPSRPLDQTN